MLDAKRSVPAPASLAREVTYTDEDVLEALYRDFRGKCYLCEREVVRGGFQVDHRRPKAEWPEGTYTWSNLYPACGYCNGRRPKSYPEGGLLSPGDGVEQRIHHTGGIDAELNFECIFTAARVGDQPAENAVHELEWVHSVETATTPGARLAARSFLDSIHDHYMSRVRPLEVKARRARTRGKPNIDVEQRLRLVLSRRAPFTMLMRSLVDSSLADLFD